MTRKEHLATGKCHAVVFDDPEQFPVVHDKPCEYCHQDKNHGIGNWWVLCPVHEAIFYERREAAIEA